ncbi:delta 5 fatty acid desaturase [Heterostelium album PN500]|uniref:Delta 5 fatty acid desaturase n=1 Tax=Heterostelium pallidum (strain ATCC 26659 / Pp 5 / PN500) TaxID=670386 RepID=D3BMF1_HETP5|nr:delta 5 fatty acid desaturase [Heterostelium album PN500]EFA77163.1 delta 5 fatty acid desaturase [Heterostelium album PN500]|eukprot:XP_020429292.1 delta 5 fatty acid desaturase [Heterostelium album PN500]
MAGKQYSWSELAKHCTEDDCWVAIEGKVYDITKWLPQHPGGKQILMLSAGRDVTNLFESYHPMSDKPQSLIGKYQIGVLSSLEHPKYVEKSKFYSTLRDRVRNHFVSTSQDPQMSVSMLTRVAFVILLQVTLYYLSHFMTTNFLLNCILAVCYGIAESWLAMHLMHDACHAALTHSPAAWMWLGAVFDFLTGGSFYAWNHQHVIGHHLYTNVRGADPDVGEGEIDFRIVTPYQTREWYHKYQHIYAPILYGLYAFKTRIQDSESFIKRTNGAIRVGTPSNWDLYTYLLGKASFIFFRVILPLQYHSVSSLACYIIIAELVFGYYLTINFQVSHIATDLKFYATPSKPEDPTQLDEDWAIAQVKTTQDYGHNSVACTFLSGGLNHQVVHHLFPSIAQDFYPQIVPILKDVCKEYGVKYHFKETFTEAIKSHIDYLYKMGNDPDYVKLPTSNKKSK